jgi:hypothetical protein
VATAEPPDDPKRNQLGRRCDLGCESWPDSEEFSVCVRCGGETTRFSNLQPLTLEEARSIKAHVDFNDYYERRCREKKIPATGQLPAWYVKQLEQPSAPITA